MMTVYAIDPFPYGRRWLRFRARDDEAALRVLAGYCSGKMFQIVRPLGPPFLWRLDAHRFPAAELRMQRKHFVEAMSFNRRTAELTRRIPEFHSLACVVIDW